MITMVEAVGVGEPATALFLPDAVEALADPVTGLAVDTRPVGRSLPRQPVAGLP